MFNKVKDALVASGVVNERITLDTRLLCVFTLAQCDDVVEDEKGTSSLCFVPISTLLERSKEFSIVSASYNFFSLDEEKGTLCCPVTTEKNGSLVISNDNVITETEYVRRYCKSMGINNSMEDFLATVNSPFRVDGILHFTNTNGIVSLIVKEKIQKSIKADCGVSTVNNVYDIKKCTLLKTNRSFVYTNEILTDCNPGLSSPMYTYNVHLSLLVSRDLLDRVYAKMRPSDKGYVNKTILTINIKKLFGKHFTDLEAIDKVLTELTASNLGMTRGIGAIRSGIELALIALTSDIRTGNILGKYRTESTVNEPFESITDIVDVNYH